MIKIAFFFKEGEILNVCLKICIVAIFFKVKVATVNLRVILAICMLKSKKKHDQGCGNKKMKPANNGII